MAMSKEEKARRRKALKTIADKLGVKVSELTDSDKAQAINSNTAKPKFGSKKEIRKSSSTQKATRPRAKNEKVKTDGTKKPTATKPPAPVEMKAPVLAKPEITKPAAIKPPAPIAFKKQGQPAAPAKSDGTGKSTQIRMDWLYSTLASVLAVMKKFFALAAKTTHQAAVKSKYPTGFIYLVGLAAFPLSVMMLLMTQERLKETGEHFPLTFATGMEVFMYVCAILPIVFTGFKKFRAQFLILLPLSFYALVFFDHPVTLLWSKVSPLINADITQEVKDKNQKLLDNDVKYQAALTEIKKLEDAIDNLRIKAVPHQVDLERYTLNKWVLAPVLKKLRPIETQIENATNKLNEFKDIKSEKENSYSTPKNVVYTDWMAITQISYNALKQDIKPFFMTLITAFLLHLFFYLLTSPPQQAKACELSIIHGGLSRKKKDDPFASVEP